MDRNSTDYGPMEEDPTMWAAELRRRLGNHDGPIVLTSREAREIAGCLEWTGDLKGKWKSVVHDGR